jgi:hypothetical protein
MIFKNPGFAFSHTSSALSPVIKEQFFPSVNHQIVSHKKFIITMGLIGFVAELVVLGCCAAAGK